MDSEKLLDAVTKLLDACDLTLMDLEDTRHGVVGEPERRLAADAFYAIREAHARLADAKRAAVMLLRK